MSKIKLSIIALSCALALSACSSSSKGGSDNSDQIRQTENELNQRISAANKKAEETAKKAEEAVKKAENAINTAKANGQQTEEEKKAAEAEKKAAEEALKAAEDRLKKLENLQADEKARIPLSDKIFGGISGNMEDAISGGVLIGKGNNINRPQARDTQHLTVIDNESGKVRDVDIFKEANAIDPWSGDQLDDDPYNLRKEGQTILSNSNFKSSAFGTYSDYLIDQYFFAQGNPTALAQIPTAGKVEYDGGAAYKKDGGDSQRTGMTATADFANKVIDINIKEKPNAVPEMNFGGKITGNSFAGEVNGIKTQGGFFGKDAQEMTGLFTNEADKSRGAFGGIKK